MSNQTDDPQKYVRRIAKSGLSIYDAIEIGDPDLWIPSPELQRLLTEGLQGMSVKGLPIRTRSKVVKSNICRILGYPVPKSFKRTKPKFPGQQFDVYTQKRNNLQIWNEEVVPTRRYAIIDISPDDVIDRVKVVTGEDLAPLDKTGTLTQKYQARVIPSQDDSELISSEDTDNLKPLIREQESPLAFMGSPIDYPTKNHLLPIAIVYKRLRGLVGADFPDKGHDQERLRGAELHRLICQRLGYQYYRDDGRFPDIRNQLLEVKLQTSPTIDLGLVRPDSEEPLDIPKINGTSIRHRDVRYAIFYGSTDGKRVSLTHFFLTTGEAFFSRFPQFKGKVVNRKLQIPLPADFFER